jgi:large subunit ribosomal protein L24
VQTTLLGLAIAFIIALITALVGPYFIDWNKFRPEFEAEAAHVVGAPVRVSGSLDARLLPTPSLRLRSVAIGGLNDLGKVRASKLDVEFSLGSLLRGEWRATELTINDVALDFGLDAQGRIDWLSPTGQFNLGSMAIDRLNLTGRIALHDALSRGTVELNDIAFSGDVRSLAGAVRGDGNFMLSGTRYPFRVSSGPTVDGSGTRVHLTIDPGQRPLSVDLDGLLTFDARSPHFDGGVTVASPAAGKGEPPRTPWRVSGKLKAAPGTARVEQLEASYGPEDNALKLAGLADIRLGAVPQLHAVLSARQVDADKLLGKDNAKDKDKDGSLTEPTRLLQALRSQLAVIPSPPLKTQFEISADQITLGGRAVQNIAADLRSDPQSWNIDVLEFRAPGTTQVVLSGETRQGRASDGFKGALSIESTDPDAFAAWLQGRGEAAHRAQKPLRLRGDISVSADRVALEAMKTEIAGGALEGRLAYARLATGGSRFEVQLKGDQLDLDAATALARAFAGPQAEWPDEGLLSLDIGRAVAGNRELRPLVARLGYGPKTISLDQLKIGDANGVAVDSAGSLDRMEGTGKLTLSATSASTRQITELIAPYVPAVAGRLNAVATAQGAARVRLALDLNKDAAHPDHASARAMLDIDAPQLKGVTTVTAAPAIAELRALNAEALARTEIGFESKLSSEQGGSLLVLLGLDHAIVAGDGPARFEGSATGAWRAPLHVKAKLSGAELDVSAEGTAEPWGQKAGVDLVARRINLAPLFDLKPSDPLGKNISLSSRMAVDGGKLTFDDLDSVVAGARIRGHVALTLGDERSIDGQLGMDVLQLGPAFGVAVGTAGHDATEPLGNGLFGGWRGQLAFQALRGLLPGGGELRPVSGVVKADGQSLRFDAIKGTIGGGEMSADIDAKPTPSGLALSARLELSGVDGTVLRYRGLALPAGRSSLRMTLASQGRSASALAGALSGNGLLTLETSRIAGLDPLAFSAAIRASDNGQATDDTKLRRIVDSVLSAGALSVASAQIPFTIEDGRLRVSATTLDADGARAIVSGGYDIAADQAAVRVSLTSTALGSETSRPEIEVFAAGSPEALSRTVDVAALSSWLAVRAIDRETKRLDSLDRGEMPPAALPTSIPPPALALPPADAAPDSSSPKSSDQPDISAPGRDLRRPGAAKPKMVGPRLPPAPPVSTPPVVSQQLAPLPPAIDIRPVPGAAPSAVPGTAPGAAPGMAPGALPSVVRPQKPRPPLALTPPASN